MKVSELQKQTPRTLAEKVCSRERRIEYLKKELTEAGHMIGVLREYISDLEKGLDSSINLNKAQAQRQVKELTDKEINKIFNTTWGSLKDYMEFARAILRKAQEK